MRGHACSNNVLVQTIRRKDSASQNQIIMNDEKWLKAIPSHIGHYLAGFADGEGSFNVSLRKQDERPLGWQVITTFNVSQRDKTVLTLFKRYLGCGRFQERKDGVWYYLVSNPTSIEERVIPFFKKFRFHSATKQKNFSIFEKIVTIVSQNGHLTPQGLRDVVALRETLNEGRGRKRKYTIDHYQASLAENPQRLYAKALPRRRRPENA